MFGLFKLQDTIIGSWRLSDSDMAFAELSDAVAVRAMNGTFVWARKSPSLLNMGLNSAPLQLIT